MLTFWKVYILVSNAKLNGNPLPSTAHVVEKQMVFTCTATWKLSNEPNCILSNQILPIPNSSYKYLGHQPDLSGHGNHGVFNNFEFAGMSGANGYLQNFSEWTKASGVSSTDSVISSSNNLVAANGWIAYVTSGTVLVAMASAEYKDREHGGAFDWYDILAGMTLPVLFGLVH